MPSACVKALVLLLASSAAQGGRVPAIPAGHRAQYSLQHADGSFKYGWDTGRGSTAQVEGDANNEVRGSYSAGPGLQVHYTAGVNGYVPTLVADGQGQGHAPPATPAPQGVKSGWSSGWSVGAPAVYAPAAHAPAVKGAHVGPAGPLRPDGSYSFSYSTGDQSRHESADAANNVRGTFSFRTEEGDRTVNYHAGANTGFVAQGAHLPTPPPLLLIPAVAIPVQIPVQGNGRWEQAGGQWDADEPEPQPEPSGPADASYQFGYQSKDGSRQEAADAGGNVQGSYSYTSPDGVQRRVDYEAGANKGFVANVQPKDEPAGPAGGIQTSWQSGGDDSLQQVLDSAQQLDLGGDGPKQPPVGGDANTQSVRGADGSYAFSYSTKDQSRQEQGDPKNNVEGSYTFVAKDDGKERRVDYYAGANTGFVAELSESGGPAKGPGVKGPSTQAPIAQEPIGQEPIDGQELIGQEPVGQEPIGQEQVTETPIQQADNPDLDIRVDDKIDLRVGTGGDDSQQTTDGGEGSGGGDGGDTQSSRGPDGSYAFSYSTKDQSREEQADAKNNVKGSFSFVAPDGVPRRVDYEAGAGKGFVAKGDHLPKQEVLPGNEAMGQQQQTQQSWDDGQQTQSPEDGDEQQTQGPEVGDGGSGDGSYSYSYETDSSRKQESADAAGNVQGSFSYNDGTGQTKTVTYTARRGEGFKAEGDHLPKPGQFLAAAAAAGVGGSVHGGAYGRGRGRLRPPVGIKSLQPAATWSQAPSQPAATWPNGLHPQGPPQDASVRTYLPPGVPGHKVGYVYEAKTR
ncbi:uncharacterized protein LOC117642099 [Thrips palmi]|uniref:Uncharacterized protein LOC117642099 n=1 Tax=Thrips palmi TaxID=161013 RepID=A0A6P8YG06_THRPL|nr:uncharacterized protein LOC117642099 [Thrips palmi]